MAKSTALVPCRKRSSIEEEEKLTDDLWVEVFLRLPNCKSAGQCGVVSRRWYSMIYNSQFISSFIRRQQFLLNPSSSGAEQPCTFLFQILIAFHPRLRKTKKPYTDLGVRIYRIFSEKSKILHQGRPLSLSSSSDYLSFFPFPIMMRASFNDLVLVTRRPFSNSCYLIGNPLTRQFVALPSPLRGLIPNKWGLVFSADGDEQNSRRLRVVLIDNRGGNNFCARIFCCETWKWSQSIVTPTRQLRGHLGPSCIVGVAPCNGMLHWVEGIASVQWIVAFDPFIERCLYIDPPENLNHDFFNNDHHMYLGTCRGQLRICHLRRDPLGLTLRVWELRDYESNPQSWQLKHETYFQGNKFRRYRVLAFHPNDVHVIFLQRKSLVDRYDWRSNIKKKFDAIPDKAGHGYNCRRLFFFLLVHPLWPTPVPKLPSIQAP